MIDTREKKGNADDANGDRDEKIGRDGSSQRQMKIIAKTRWCVRLELDFNCLFVRLVAQDSCINFQIPNKIKLKQA